MRKDRDEIKRMYENGFSCSQLSKMYGVTRQSIHILLTRMGTQFRKTKLLPYIMYDGRKWTISKTTGYYRDTAERKHNVSLHRYIWEKHNGPIPCNYDIHHIDENKSNNDLSNLQMILKANHTRLHCKGYNQFRNSRTILNEK